MGELRPTHPFKDAGLVRTDAEDEQWVTPDDRWGIQVRRDRHTGMHLGWDVFSTCWMDGQSYVEAIHAQGFDTYTEALEALAWHLSRESVHAAVEEDQQDLDDPSRWSVGDGD